MADVGLIMAAIWLDPIVLLLLERCDRKRREELCGNNPRMAMIALKMRKMGSQQLSPVRGQNEP